ncbi:P-loop containing nucleoside triphosphate hydrolase protein [Xylaria arbuscula]|nr:P-loop containing nucleoside triphosphate hydrolase protein [Xylaria arbuscula]
MENAREDSAFSELVKQLASLEQRFIQLEERCTHIPAAGGTTVSTNHAPVTADQKASDSGGKTNESLSRVKIIISKRDSEGEPVESTESPPKTKGDDNSGHAFILKKIIFDSTSGKENESEINITNVGLWNLLKRHLRGYPYHIFSESPVTLESPYEPIIFSWDKLLEVAASPEEDEDSKLAKADLKLLLDTISSGSSGDLNLDKFFKIRGNYKSQEQETIQFNDLWTIFPPGTLIYGKPFQGEDQVFLVKDNKSPWPKWDSEAREAFPWKLEAWSWDWKDESFGRTYFQRYCNSKDESRLFDYKGKAIAEKKGFSGMKGDDEDNQHEFRNSRDFDLHFIRRLRLRDGYSDVIPNASSFNVEGRVMVDFVSFYKYGSNNASSNGRNGPLLRSESRLECGCSDCQANEALANAYRTRFDSAPKNQVWEEEQYLLCPPRVLGYVLTEKQWAQLQVSCLKEVPRADGQNNWHTRMKLADEDSKKLLFDLIQCHVSSETNDNSSENALSVNDIVPGKGKGLVILLYGPPGVGKTSTAETIAVAARKPLFSISVADVGTQAKHVESNLSKIFSLAAHWKAILLIDEADVFLESRGRVGEVQSMDRNALVSVFLRVLEYYSGIMFLTTNQIAEFDVAIPSRIHIAIKYESLRPDQMEAIFKGFLENLRKRNLIDDYDGIMSWLKEDVYSEGLDGRQIRNVVTTALDLANAEPGNYKLKQAHLKRAWNNTKRFTKDFDRQMERYKNDQGKLIK